MLNERQQILSAIEIADGLAVTPTSNDASLIYEPDCDDDVTFLERRPAGSTLSQAPDPAGLTLRRNTFKSDFRGSGVVTTAPEWGKHCKASAMREMALVRLPLTGVSSTEQYTVGEIVYQGASVAAATAIGICLTHLRGADGSILVATLAGTWAAATTIGRSCAASATAGTPVTADQGFGYVPDSLRLLSISVASWTPGAPAAAAIGAVMQVTRGGFVVGAIQVIDAGAGGTWATTIQAVLLYGEIADTDVLTDGTTSGTINDDPVQIRTPSLTIWNNLDGFLRKTAGSRGTFTLGGEAGGPLVFSWDFLGKAESHSAALPVATGALGATRPPRLFGAFVGLRSGAQFYRMPVKRLELNLANTVGPREDANAAGGSIGTVVTARRPVISIEVEQVGMAFDVLGMRNAESEVALGAVLGGDGTGTYAGRTAGNTCVLAAPNLQVKQVKPGNSNGIATWQIDAEPKKFQDAGDDEVVLAMF